MIESTVRGITSTVMELMVTMLMLTMVLATTRMNMD
jgi:hypothetical protein